MTGSGADPSRAHILARVRAALSDVPPDESPGDVPVPREYRRGGGPPAGDAALVDLFAARVGDYRARVRRAMPDAVATAVSETLSETLGEALDQTLPRRVAVPDGFPAGWLPELHDLTVVRDVGPLSVAELDRLDGVLTAATVAVAETGTIVLSGGRGQGRRALTLVPDYHLCVVEAEQIVGGLPEAMALLDPSRPLTFISGPSATSDIELDRVEGVHGPRTLEVIIVNP